MEVILGIAFFLFILHLIAYSSHRLYWKRRLLTMLLEMDEKDLISRERYLALLDEYDPNPLAFDPFRFSIFQSLPDEIDWPELFQEERYRKFEERHSGIRRYLIKVLILLGLTIFGFGAFLSTK